YPVLWRTVSDRVSASKLPQSSVTLNVLLSDATAYISLTKNSRSFAWSAKIRSLLRRPCGVVMDEEYVQEHILIGGIVAPVSSGLAVVVLIAFGVRGLPCRRRT